jgi:hypothetical protein
MTPVEAYFHPINELIRDVWDGKISEARFVDCAMEAGADLNEVKAVLREIREDDGVLT